MPEVQVCREILHWVHIKHASAHIDTSAHTEALGG